MKDRELVFLLKKGDRPTLKKLYVDYRSDFIAFARKISKSESDILDAYQDTLIIVQEKAINGDLDLLKGSLKTYVFGVGKYILFEKNRRKTRTVLQLEHDNE